MVTFSTLLTLWEGNPRSPVDSLRKGQVTPSFDVFFDAHLNRRLSKHSRRRSFELPSRSLWRHCNDSWSIMTGSVVWNYTHYKVWHKITSLFSNVKGQQFWKTELTSNIYVNGWVGELWANLHKLGRRFDSMTPKCKKLLSSPIVLTIWVNARET